MQTSTGQTPMPSKVLWLFSAVLVVCVSVLSGRYLYFVPWLPTTQFAAPLLCLAAACVCVVLTLRHRLPFVWREELYRAWPLLLLVVCTMAYYLYAYVTNGSQPVGSQPPPPWWGSVMFSTLALLAAYLLGACNRGCSNRAVAWLLLIIVGLSFFVGLCQCAHYSGWTNAVAVAVERLNTHTREVYSVWQWTPGEVGIRVQGLNNYPAQFAIIGVVGAAWACVSTDLRWQRAVIFVCSVGIIVLSGTRVALVSLLVVCICYLVGRLPRPGSRGFSWYRVGVVLAFGLALLVVTFFFFRYTSPGHSLGRFVFADAAGVGSREVALQTYGKGLSAKVDTLLSGRLGIWRAAIQTIGKYPLGTGHPMGNIDVLRPDGSLLFYTNQAHNEFLNSWLIGGPTLFLPLVLFWIWLARFRTRGDISGFGLVCALGIGLYSLTEPLLFDLPLLALCLFLLGGLAWMPPLLNKHA